MRFFRILFHAWIPLIILLASVACRESTNDAPLLLGALAGLDAAPGPTYYVDSVAGDDSFDGLSTTTPWKSLNKVNTFAYPWNSIVLFKRGGTWRGQLLPVSRNTYSAYGDGAKPILMGSADKGATSDWVDEGGNIWRSAAAFETDVGNLIMNGATVFGFKKWTAADLTAQGHYYYDRSTGFLRLYSAGNPGTFYTAIEAALRKHVVNQQGAFRVAYGGLSIKYGAAHGFGGGNTSQITIRDCDISYIGGGDLNMNGDNIRFGNGVEFWSNANNHLVERNRIFEIYDTALTNQNHTTASAQYNITYRNNVIWNTGLASFEYWNRPGGSTTANIRFEHNTAVNAGSGWGAPPQRPDTVGVHVFLLFNEAATSELMIRNNIFHGGNRGFFASNGNQWAAPLLLDNNCWYQASGDLIELQDTGTKYTLAQFSAWKSFSGKSTNGVTGDALFTSAAGNDYSLTASSPCVDKAADAGLNADITGSLRPAGIAPDMGAYER